MEKKQTLVIGASENPGRYSNLAIQKLLAYGHPVVAIGARAGKIGTIEIGISKINFPGIDTVTLYLNPARQQEYYDYILSLHPRRIIFNPGTENEALETLANAAGIETLEACTLVMLGTGQY
ncbi:MAG TPA: CoA-binding protein [Ferruginibacter sp.]|nr:CoA-binding protein [Ferruginibacter sp.]HMP20810.1 CoA-binding protein [Ferruginibacter sp.]